MNLQLFVLACVLVTAFAEDVLVDDPNRLATHSVEQPKELSRKARLIGLGGAAGIGVFGGIGVVGGGLGGLGGFGGGHKSGGYGGKFHAQIV